MTAPIFGVMEYLNGPIVEWRIDCPTHGRVSSADVAVVAEHANHLPYIVTAPYGIRPDGSYGDLGGDDA